MATSADLLNRIRTAIDDVAGDKTVFKENLGRSILGNQVGAGNLSFQLNNKRIVPGTLRVSQDGGAFVAAATEDDLHGRFTTALAPATSLLAIYDFQYFTDTDVTTEMNGSAASFIGFTDVTQIPDGLTEAFVKKAAGDLCLMLSTRAAPYYSAGAGGKTVNRDNISRKYADLAKEYLTDAETERLAFYGQRKGKSSSPSFGMFSTKQKVWTPIR